MSWARRLHAIGEIDDGAYHGMGSVKVVIVRYQILFHFEQTSGSMIERHSKAKAIAVD